MPNQIGYEVIGKADRELLQKLRQEESERINQEVLIEREWWSSKVVQDENEALEDGRLVVVPDEGDHFRLIGRLRREEEPDTLNPQAYRLLFEIQEEWVAAMKLQAIPIEGVFLSLISLYRSPELQLQVMQETYLASKGISAHGAGAAIDFDPNGYYFGDDRRSIQAGNGDFRRIYTLVLKRVLEGFVAEGSCHVIWESGIKIEDDLVIRYTACYHVCVSPDFKSSE